jgi:hypothetical protein
MKVYTFDQGILGVIVAPNQDAAIRKMAEELYLGFEELIQENPELTMPSMEKLKESLYEVADIEEFEFFKHLGLTVNPNKYSEITYLGAIDYISEEE